MCNGHSQRTMLLGRVEHPQTFHKQISARNSCETDVLWNEEIYSQTIDTVCV